MAMLRAAGLARAIAARELSAREVVDDHLKRIEELNPRLNALTRTLDAVAIGEGPLAGVPFSVKENVDLAGTPTTFGLRGEFPHAAHDSPDVAHLRAAGAVPVARGNLPDLALRWHTESARYGVTLNPWDERLSPGGSSGGDAVAVATGMVAFAVGTDYGGSLRVPAALAGVCTLRPTPGRFPMASSAPQSMSRQLFATDGLLARSIEDLALLAPIMAQPSARDPRYTPAQWGNATHPSLDLAVLAGEELDAGPAEALRRAASAAAGAGHRVHETAVPRLRELAELWRDVLAYDTGPVALPRLREGGCDGTLRFVESLLAITNPLDGPGYARALAERHALAAEWSQLFARHPVLIAPVNCREPWPVGHDLDGDAAVREQWWGFRVTVATSALGLPAIALPAGLDERGNPLAVQLLAARWQEPLLLAIAADLERRLPPCPTPPI
jgi:amidase